MNQPGTNEQDKVPEKNNVLTAEDLTSQLHKIRRKLFWRNLLVVLLICLFLLSYLPRGFEYITRPTANISNSNEVITRQTSAGTLRLAQSKGGKKYTAVTVDIRKANLNLFYRDENDEPFRSFDGLGKWLSKRNERLVFATNAGMFNKGFFPLGLHVEHGSVLQKMHLPKPNNNRSNNIGADSVVGNFDLPHNGVFRVHEGKAAIVETRQLAAVQDWGSVQLATQSGPMLLIDGAINPEFNENSGNLKIRSGVGIIDDNAVVFVISEDPINFYDFALVFREDFKCQNALFLDGAISKMYIYENDGDNIDESIFAGMLAITVPKN